MPTQLLRGLSALARSSSPHLARLRFALALIGAVSLVGTVGYHVLEGWGWLDSFYMTIITVATVGFGEVHDLNAPGMLFTVFLIISSIGIVGYSVTSIAAFVVEGEFNRIIRGHKMDKKIAGLKDHIVLCGAGLTGRSIATELEHSGTPFVVVEQSPEVLAGPGLPAEVPGVTGDATDDDVLRQAGIERAKGLIAVLGEDKDNVFVVLSARALNPKLRIVARVNEEGNAGKLRKAGADEVVAPDAIGGLRMASMMVRPAVVTFLDAMLRVTGHSILLEEISVGEESEMIGRSLREADLGRRTGAQVVAIKSGAGTYQFHPGADRMLEAGDTLIVMATPEQIAELRGLNG